MKTFETTTCGKWILAGEHAVLRGSPALVFPLPGAQLQFRYTSESAHADIELELSGSAGAELDLLFWGVLEKACALTGLRRKDLSGRVSLQNDIPVGAGLGASAAFCVAVARWFQNLSSFEPERVESFAQELENLFHGESSGVDIAVAHSGRPLKFYRNGERSCFEPYWQPHLYLAYSGQRGVTRECVAKVKGLLQAEPEQARRLDERMREAVQLAERALFQDEKTGYPLLLKAIGEAAHCFESWGLFEGLPEREAKKLATRGAEAIKPTGSGGGGYLLSLWPAPPADPSGLISCFRSGKRTL